MMLWHQYAGWGFNPRDKQPRFGYYSHASGPGDEYPADTALACLRGLSGRLGSAFTTTPDTLQIPLAFALSTPGGSTGGDFNQIHHFRTRTACPNFRCVLFFLYVG